MLVEAAPEMTVEEALSGQLALVAPELVAMDDIFLDHDWNSRGEFSQASIIELADSIRDTGLRDAILVRPTTAYPGYKYQIVYGHRRYAAHKWLNRPFIPAKIATLTEDTALVLNIKENLERLDVNYYQQATGIWRLLDMGYSVEMLKSRLNQSTRWLNDRIKLRSMDAQVHRLAALGIFKPTHIERITKIPTLNGKMMFLRQLQDKTVDIESGDMLVDLIDRIAEKSKARPNDLRSPSAIAEMQRRFQAVLGVACHEALAMAWCGGWISDEEFYDHLELRAQAEGKFFRRPEPIPLAAIEV